MASKPRPEIVQYMEDEGWSLRPAPFSKPESRLCHVCDRVAGLPVFCWWNEDALGTASEWVYKCFDCAIREYEGDPDRGIEPAASEAPETIPCETPGCEGEVTVRAYHAGDMFTPHLCIDCQERSPGDTDDDDDDDE